MSESNFERKVPGRKVEERRIANDRRDAAIKSDIEKERVRSLAKTARLRALRLEKDAAVKAATEKQPVPSVREVKQSAVRATARR